MNKAEKFIQDYTRNCSNLMQVPTLDDKGNIVPEAHPWLTPDQARRAVEIARKEMIEWIENNIEQYPVDNWDKFVNSLITDLKQAIKDE